jgi:hypothetical protein
VMRNWLAAMQYGRSADHTPSALTTRKPRRKARRAATSSYGRCELDDDAEIAAPVDAPAAAVNRCSKAYGAGYGDGAAVAREESVEAAFSAQHAGKADELLLSAVGVIEMARILGVAKPAGASLTTTPEFRSACDEYNAGYAAGLEAGEIATLESFAQL